MNSLKFMAVGLCASSVLHAQLCDFDSGTWPYSIASTSTGTHLISSGSPDAPMGTTYGVNGSNALVCSGGTIILELGAINTLAFPKASFSFRIAANAEPGSGQGMDGGTDYVKVQWRTGQSSSFTDVLKLKGYRNALWGMSDWVSQVELPCSNYEEVTPFDRGYLPFGAPGHITISDLPQDTALEFRIEIHSDRSNETWSIDNIKCTLPTQWTNASGDGDPNNPLNWTAGLVPNAESALLLTDTLASPPPSDTLEVASLITWASDSVSTVGWKLKVGQWFHEDGVAIADTHLIISNQLGIGELTVRAGEVIGEISLEQIPHSYSGWRNMCIPVNTVWGDLIEDVSNAPLGPNGSVYGWDAGNAAWFSMGSSNYSSRYPMTIYGGPNWMDSSNAIVVKGALRGLTDTAFLQYGVPGPTSPFGVAAGNEGWNLIANPYPFPIALDKLFADLDYPVDLAPTAYLWSTKDQQYRSYNLTTGPVSGATNVIAPWQAFWVQLNANPGGMIPLVLKAEHRAMPGGDVLRKSSAALSVFNIKGPGIHRDLRIADISNTNLQFEGRYDHKQRNREGVHAFFETTDILPMRLSLKSLDPSKVGGVTLAIVSDEIRSLQITLEEYPNAWWLENTQTGEWVNLAAMPYKFEVMSGDTLRFRLWRTNKLDVTEAENALNCHVPRLSDREVHNSSDETWYLYDKEGRVILKLLPQATALIPDLFGVYIWRTSECFEKVFIDSSNP
ncbi:MAG: hypothetical protein HWD92_01640 [Flavobacteriia bacterium]|nr:hypothetical protein [Flavobacteriia bacterium]